MDGSHHLLLRKRVYKHLEAFPDSNVIRRYFDYLMAGVSVLAPLPLLPQLIEVYGKHSAQGLSIVTWSLLAMVNLLWITYALLHKEKLILTANIGAFLVNLSIVIGIALYG